jgi:hypothetical protein
VETHDAIQKPHKQQNIWVGALSSFSLNNYEMEVRQGIIHRNTKCLNFTMPGEQQICDVVFD